MVWIVVLDVVVALLGLVVLGLLAWRLVIRPGLRLSRTVTEVGAKLSVAVERVGIELGDAVGELGTRVTDALELVTAGADTPSDTSG